MMQPETSDNLVALLGIGAILFAFYLYEPLGWILLAWLLWRGFWNRFGPPIKYSLSKWERDTNARIQSESDPRKAKTIELLEQYKARKKSGN